MLSVKRFFWVVSLISLLPFVPVCLSSAFDPCPYPSCLCLPSLASFFFVSVCRHFSQDKPTSLLALQPEIGGLHIGVVHEFLVGAFQNGATIFKNIPVVDDRQNGTGILFRNEDGNSCL